MKTFLLGGALLAVGFGAFAACTWGDYNGVLPPYDAGPEGSAPSCSGNMGCGNNAYCVNGSCLQSCAGNGDNGCPSGQRCLVEQTDNGGSQQVCVTHDEAMCCPSGCSPCGGGSNGNSVACAPDNECRQTCNYDPAGGPQQQGSCESGEHCVAQGSGCQTCGFCYGTPDHDPGTAPDAGGIDGGPWPSTLMPSAGGQLTSDDGLFTAVFFMGSVSTATRVSISRNLQSSGLPTFCASSMAVSCWSSAYTLTLATDPGGTPAQLTNAIALEFALGPSAFGVPQTETFIVAPGPQGPQAMPGVWATNGNVDGVQSANGASTLGPYAIVHSGTPAVPSSTACNGGDVCNACARGCGSSRLSPAPSAGIHEACICTGPSPSTDQYLASCVSASSETCN